MKNAKCGKCGRASHSTEDCWSQITCQECGGIGHPGSVCWKRCLSCNNVHERGQCGLKEAMEELSRWSRGEGDGVELPASVRKHLDTLHLNF